MKKLLVVLLVLAGMRGMGQVPTWEWGKCPKSNGQGEEWGFTVDKNGNSYITGNYSGTLYYGLDTLITPSSTAFIAKYDSSGNILWGKSASNVGAYGFGVASDAFGNVYLTGYFLSPTVTFDSITLTNAGGYDIFLVKYNTIGNVVWAKDAGGINNDDAFGIATDTSGSVIITGNFESPTITFGSYTLINSGNSNIYIAKYDSYGNVLWAKNSNGAGTSESATTDGSNNTYITGGFNSSQIIFGYDTLHLVGGEDIFLTKYDALGNVIWAKSAGGNLNDAAYSVVTGIHGNVYITGSFSSPSLVFGSDTLFNIGASNAFIAKYDSTGNILWTRSSTGLGNTNAFSVVEDSCETVDIIGSLYDTVNFGTINLTPSLNNSDNMFLVKYNSSGSPIWGASIPFGGDDINSIAADPLHNIYIGGDFAPDTIIIASDTLIRTIGELPFVAKLHFNISCNEDIGIPKISPQPSTSLFPNPFSTSATLSIRNYELGIRNGEVQIFNLLGEAVKSIPIINQKEITINRDNLAEGMYFYKIINQNKETVGVGKMVIEL